MKNLNFLWLFAILAIMGCTQEETFPEETSQDFSRQLMYEENGEIKILDLGDIDRTNSNNTLLNKNNGNSSHAHGSYLINVTNLVDFSVTENNGGTHGSIVLTIDTGLDDPEIMYMDTYCVSELGNGTVVFAGTPSSIENDVLNFYELGQTYYFFARDNGQGKNAASDQAIITALRAIDSDNPPACSSFTEADFDAFINGDIGNNSANMQSPYSVKVN